MLTKITRQDCLNKYPNFPQRDDFKEAFFYPKVFASYVLNLESKTFKGHIKSVALELTQLIKRLGYESLIFLGDTKIAWRYQDNEYESVQTAVQFLEDNKVGKKFNGALKVNVHHLPDFLVHLMWLTRSNAALPCFYFMDEGQNIVANICKYGNLHIDILNPKVGIRLKRLIKESKFKYLSTKECYDQFEK